METESNKKKYCHVWIEQDRSPDVIVELDDSIDPEDLEGDNKFFHMVKNQLLFDIIHDSRVCVLECESQEVNKEPFSYIYKDEDGDFREGYTVPVGTQTVMEYSIPPNENTFLRWKHVCFDTPLQKTKELWVKQDIEGLKKRFIPSSDSKDPDVLDHIYKLRNHRVDYILKDKDWYCSRDSKGQFEVLVNNLNPESESVS